MYDAQYPGVTKGPLQWFKYLISIENLTVEI